MKEKILNKVKKLTTILELKEQLAPDASSFKELIKSLNELEDEGLLVNIKDKYDLAKNHKMYVGTITINKKGFGFVETELEEDIFVPKRDINNAMHSDKVLVQITQKVHGLKAEGKILRVIQRNNPELIGLFRDGYVLPDDTLYNKCKISGHHNAVNGHKVRVRITDFYNDVLKGEIVEVIGHRNDPGIDILSIIYKHKFTPEFPKKVMEEIKHVEEVESKEVQGRTDLRDKMFITIDGADAKDLDDAVCLEKHGDIFKLYVSIADVSHYVEEGSALDKEALKRSTSVYLVDRVVPMLPHKLSNGICSLNPHVDRLTLTCEMNIDKSGNVVDHSIYESVINSKYRMTYKDVNLIIKGDIEKQTEYAEVTHLFYEMNKLRSILNKRRVRRGAINFETNEPKIIVDSTGKPLDIVIREREESEKIIEEMMLIANETVAEHFHWLDLPFIYRVHDEPDESKLNSLIKLTRMLGFDVKGVQNGVHPQILQELLEQVESKPGAHAINTLMLRSMAKAKYSELSTGHYGLATKYYTHFTSPIRRYPDLMVHRLIREFAVKKDLREQTIKHYTLIMPEIANQTSRRERDAVSCERDVDSMKMAEYMMDHVDEEFDGVVSSVTGFGMFVELPNGVEGLVHINDMKDDYYEYLQDRYVLVGRRKKKVYTIGDQIRVKCINANKREAKVDFMVAGEKNAKRNRKNYSPKQKS